MESKLQYAAYQNMRHHYVNVYQTFSGPLTFSGVAKVFGDVERDAGTIFNNVKTAGMKVEEPRAAVLELAGRTVKVYSTILIEREYPESEKEKTFKMPDFRKLEKAVGQKIK